MFYYLLLTFHVAFTAVWFGNSLMSPGRFRRALKSGANEIKFAVEEGSRAARISIIFGAATFLSGILIAMRLGGLAKMPRYIHMSMGIVFLMLLIEIIFVRGIWSKLSQAVANGAQPESLNSFRGKLAMFSGIIQLLWLVVLYLMVVTSVVQS
jgi:hypothetical protein